MNFLKKIVCTKKKRKNPPAEICPVACCAGDRYIICIPTSSPLLIQIICGDRKFTCDDNGVLKSSCFVQQFSIPREFLDAAGGYTVRFAEMRHRKPYRSDVSPFTERRFVFAPLPDVYPLRITHLSDVHGRGAQAIDAAAFFSQPDLLILNGDISSSSNTTEEILLPLQIAYAVTKGEKPCVITRGNHDLRGALAERLSDVYPTDRGKMYYGISFPAVRFLVLDCGEDKDDSHVEYSGTVAFHQYRRNETSFIHAIASDSAFNRDDSPLIVISHIPFPHTDGEGEFAIEQALYADWCQIIRERLRPAFALFGHHHQTVCFPAGDPFDTKGIGCPIILGGKPGAGEPTDETVAGAFITLRSDAADIQFVSGGKKILNEAHISF